MISCKNNFGETVQLPKEKFQFRPSVYGIIRNGNTILVQKNKSDGKIWFPGGGIDLGETREQALRREIFEETGLKNITILDLRGSFENFFYHAGADLAMHAFLFFYECTTTETAVLPNSQINDEEAQDSAWVSIDSIQQEDLSDLNREIYQMLRSLHTP